MANNINKRNTKDYTILNEFSDIVSDYQIPMRFAEEELPQDTLRVLSLFSGFQCRIKSLMLAMVLHTIS